MEGGGRCQCHWPRLLSLQAVLTEQMERRWPHLLPALLPTGGDQGTRGEVGPDPRKQGVGERGQTKSRGGAGCGALSLPLPHDTREGQVGEEPPGPSVLTVMVALSPPWRLGWAAWGCMGLQADPVNVGVQVRWDGPQGQRQNSGSTWSIGGPSPLSFLMANWLIYIYYIYIETTLFI